MSSRWFGNPGKMVGIAALATALCTGCSISPKSFKAMNQPEAIKRARAVGFGEEQPDWVAIPTLIQHLDDPDPVVRMTSNDALKRRTRQDFGFIPWAPPEERSPAVQKWKAWWASKMPANPLVKTRRRS